MPKRFQWFIVASLLVVSVALAGKKNAKPAKDHEAQLEDLLRLHNKERGEAGAGELRLNDKLCAAAQEYAEFLAKNNKFSHTADGSPGQRIKREGYHGRAYGENIAKGQPTPQSVVKAWMHSDGHRKNILNKRYRDVGFGIARGAKGAIIWVTDFGG